MKTLVAIIVAFIGALAGIFLFGHLSADYYVGTSEFTNPDDFGETHSNIYLAVVFGCMLVGYFIGRLLGGIIERRLSN